MKQARGWEFKLPFEVSLEGANHKMDLEILSKRPKFEDG